MFQDAFARRGVTHFTTVKGLEGSCDLPRERTAIIGLGNPKSEPSPTEPEATPHSLDRLHLHPRDFGFDGSNVPLESTAQAIAAMQSVLSGQPSELMQSTLWNSSFYLWRCRVCPSIEAGITEAKRLLISGQVKETLQTLQQTTAPLLTH